MKTEKALKRVITSKKSDHKPKRKYNCTYEGCDKVFSSTTSLYRHEDIIHFKLDAIYCEYPDCGYKTFNKLSFNKHIENHSNYSELSSQTNVCHYEGCNEVFTDKKSWIKHRNRIHRYNCKFQCTHSGCDFTAQNNRHLKQHLIKHSNEKPFVCSVDGCGKRFKHQFNYKDHLEVHKNNKYFECTFEGCGKRYETRAGLSIHMKTVHIKDTLYSCEWPGCEFKTFQKVHLGTHQKVHGDKTYLCDYPDCNAKFKYDKNLKAHRLKEHGIGNGFECSWPGCDFKAIQKCTVKYHERIHTNERRYACTWPGCQYRCVAGGNIQSHMKIHQK